MISKTAEPANGLFGKRAALVLLAASLTLALVMGSGVFCVATASEDMDNVDFEHAGDCSLTSKAAFKACRFEIRDDFWIAVGNCSNLADPEARAECLAEADAALEEASELCEEQLEARLAICEELGEDPYDPVIDPGDFVDFEAVLSGAGAFDPNPYFPLVPGTRWVYAAKDSDGNRIEVIRTEVKEETKEILGVNCIVVRDRVWEFNDEGERELIEDTDDWYAQDLAGNVWYFGEIAQNFEDGELVDIDGSWKAGRDFDKPGFLMLAAPVEGRLYRQEFSLGNAEDMGRVAGFVDALQVRRTRYENVLQTADFTPVEPDVLEFKYYAPGVGLVLEENPETGERVELRRVEIP